MPTTEKTRRLELLTAVAALLAAGMSWWVGGGPSWLVVFGFGTVVVLAENTPTFVHLRLSASASIMVALASVAILQAEGGSNVPLSAAFIAAFGGIYKTHIVQRRFGLICFNAGQLALAAMTGTVSFEVLTKLGTGDAPAALVGATVCVAVNAGLVVPEIAKVNGERARVVWSDMRPAVPNAVALTALGLLLGMLCARLGPVAVALLVVPLVVGRWSYASFERLRGAQERSIGLFIRLIEAKDPYTAGHTERVATFSLYIAEELGLSPERTEHLRRSALMHDVGKLAVPNRLLNKPGRLTPDEYDVMCRHHTAGVGILATVDFLRDMALPASDRHGHFEHAAGRLPSDLVLEAHIVSVADAFDAMTSTRAYRRALDHDVAISELRTNAGTQFSPRCVDALVTALERRNERYGSGYETPHVFATPPPAVGVGSAGLGNLSEATT